MKALKFSDAQKAFILKQGADGIPVAEICRRAGISQATYFNWKMKYDGLLPTEMKWPAAGFVDTEIRCLTELESWNAEKEVQPRVQA